MPSEIELAYAAGVIDGEGCIRIAGKTGQQAPYLVVIVSNTNELLLLWFKQRWGGDIQKKRDCKNPRRKPSYDWRIGYTRALNFIQAIRPYLVIKQPQADLALRLAEIKKSKRQQRRVQEVKVVRNQGRFAPGTVFGPGNSFTEDTIQQLVEVKNAMHQLNRRGVVH